MRKTQGTQKVTIYYKATKGSELKRATEGSAGYDIFVPSLEHSIPETVYTGIFIQIPKGFYGQIKNRSSKGNLFFEGVIDSDYTGEIILKRNLHGVKDRYQLTTNAIAQILILPIGDVRIFNITDDTDNTVDYLQEIINSERGIGGFGSTDGYLNDSVESKEYLSTDEVQLDLDIQSLKETAKMAEKITDANNSVKVLSETTGNKHTTMIIITEDL